MADIYTEIDILSNYMFAPKGRAGVIPGRARQAAAAVINELNELRDIVKLIDARTPRADSTCDEPGITLSEAARRELAEQREAELKEMFGA